MFIAIRLARAGYFDGNPDNVLNAPVETVQAILEYEDFLSDYDIEYIALNQE